MLDFKFDEMEKGSNRDKEGHSRFFARAREAYESPFVMHEDSDLEYVSDKEIIVEGSEPLSRLPQLKCIKESLPTFLRGLVGKGTTPFQEDVILLASLATIGATLNKTLRTMYGGKWYYPNMLLFVVAPAASGKGVLSWVRRLAVPFHEEVRSRVHAAMNDYRRQKLLYDNLGRKRAEVDAKDIPNLPPNRMFLIAGNNSGTGMLQNIMDSDGVGLIFETEADTVSTALNADYGHWNDALRNTFDHERIAFNRRQDREYREVESTFVSMVLSGTPAQVKPLITSVENGLFSRFLYYYMPGVRCWVSQFYCQEDMSEWFLEQGRRWKGVVSLLQTEVSLFTFQLTASQQNAIDVSFDILFETSQRSHGDEIVSSVLRLAPTLLRIMSMVALLRALEECGWDGSAEGTGFADGSRVSDVLLRSEHLRPAHDLPAESVSDGICPRWELSISDGDFNSCLKLLMPLYEHCTHILSLLPAVEVSNRQSYGKERLFAELPHSFTRSELIDKAGELEIPESTALTWLKRGLSKRAIVKTGRGEYEFVNL